MWSGVLLAFDDVVEELSILHVLHDEEELFGGFDDLVELDDVGVSDQLEDVDLSGDPLNVSHIHDLLFLEDLDGYFFPGSYMNG